MSFDTASTIYETLRYTLVPTDNSIELLNDNELNDEK